MAQKPDPKWKVYEKAVAEIKRKYADVHVEYDHDVLGRRSQINRQVDVWLTADVAGEDINIAIECKYTDDRPVSIKDVDAFFGFLDDVGAHKGVLVSTSGFTKGASQRAESPIALRTLTFAEAMDFAWADFVEEDGCEVPGCYGLLDWDERHCAEGGDAHPPPYEAGFCNACYSFHIKCGNCGEIDFYEPDGVIQCSSCEMRWEVTRDRKGEFLHVEQIEPADE